MRIRFSVAAACLIALLTSCRSSTQESLLEKRLTVLENAMNVMAQSQRKQQGVLERLVVRQKNLGHGVQRLSHRQKISKEWIAAMRRALEEDGGRLEELSYVLNKMIGPLQKMNVQISQLRMRVHQLRQQQGELARQMPGAPKPLAVKEQPKKPLPETSSQPVDKKKRRRVLESVA